MTPMDEPEAREALAKLEERLRRDTRDMLEVLRADVPVFFRRTVKALFEESDAADALDAAAVKRLKADADRRADEVAQVLGARLEPLSAWLWDGAAPPPREAKGLDEHPTVGPALAEVGAALAQVLEAHGLPTTTRPAYRLPTYFVAGHYMKSLVEGYWQALALHHDLAQRLAADAREDQRKARRARWDSV
ncbi:MAG: hypothetical protein KF878_21720 [Planctomycetes bacterium]|nr:hypothetical protein [Planctomycetota bacterium]